MSVLVAASIRHRAAPFVVAGALGAAALLGGCGGTAGATAESASAKPGSPGYVVKSDDPVTVNGEVTEIGSGKYPNGHDTDEESASGTPAIKPCSLVTRAQANAILGGNVRVSERLQGPTCVFSGSGRQVSLVIQKVPLRTLREEARKSTPVTIAGRTGWCLRYEMSSVVIGIGMGRVLQVSGACPAGVRFAAAALPRIPS